MASRLKLHQLLKAIPGVVEAYFQRPETVQMVYPSIVYNHSDTLKQHADNHPYHLTRRYELTVMSRDPDDPIFDIVERLPMCTFNRAFARDELNHKVFNLYF